MLRPFAVAVVGLSMSLALAACGGGGAEPTPAVTPTPVGVSYCLPQVGDNGVAGGQAVSGPFIFDLALYTDPILRSRQEADHPSRTSDIPGVGFRATWIYTGPTTELGPQAYGLLSNVVSDIEGGIEGPVPLDRPELQAGASGGRGGGGVVLAPDAKDGDRIGLGIRVRTLEGTYGAALFFTLREQDGRRFACDVTVTQWSE